MSILPPTYSIPPELFPNIALYIPLRSSSQTLLSLALGNHRFYAIVRPLLYSRLVLGNEDAAIFVIQNILNEPQLGVQVTELHIMADLGVESREREQPFDVLNGLQMLIKGKLLPRLYALGINLTNGRDYYNMWNAIPISSHGQLREDFWKTLRIECPGLKSMSLHGDVNSHLSENAIDKIIGIPGLSVLRLELAEGLSETDYLKVLYNLKHLKLLRLSASLHTLSLKADMQKVEQLISINFPNLKRLRLERFLTSDDVSNIIAFFMGHPQLQSLELIRCTGEWFSDGIEEGFLPNLNHLKARFEDIRHLTLILPQLLSLAFTRSYNCQVPYLLRTGIPNGLPRLRSLEIEQIGATWTKPTLEGVQWYESMDGQFHTEKERKNMIRTFTDDYMHSIVRGAPNLEELGLHGRVLSHEDLMALGPVFSQFKYLKRLYYLDFSTQPRQGTPSQKEHFDDLLAGFLHDAETLAQLCKSLQRVTNINRKYLPYLSVVFDRDHTGNVLGARRNDGVGMEVPAQDDDPFPYT